MSHSLPGLTLNRRSYTLAELKAGEFSSAGTAFEIATLDFCHQWLTGVDEFTITTSGSTGTPKPILLRRTAIEASARATINALGLNECDVALVCLDTRYIAGKMMLARALIKGMDIIAAEPVANPFLTIPQNQKIDFTALVPYQLKAILESPDTTAQLNNLKAVLIGGAQADAGLVLNIQNLNPGIYATYGMTETISHVALQKLNPPGVQDYFQLLPGIHIEKDDRGCLVIDAPYLGPEKIITNDVIELISPTQFRWLGRYDNVINTGGVKVIPEKIEKIIESYFRVEGIQNRFFIAGVPDNELGNAVVLIIEGNLSDTDAKKIATALRVQLSRFEVPRKIKFAAKFQETETGKINRKATIKID